MSPLHIPFSEKSGGLGFKPLQVCDLWSFLEQEVAYLIVIFGRLDGDKQAGNGRYTRFSICSGGEIGRHTRLSLGRRIEDKLLS